MIGKREYYFPANFDSHSIESLHFANRLLEMDDQKEIEIIYTGVKEGVRYYALHINPGLSVIIKNESPVMIKGDSKDFKKGLSLIEKLLDTKLLEEKK